MGSKAGRTLYLDREEERALQGERGEATRWAMEVLVGEGDAAGAMRMIPVSSVHVPGWYRHRASEVWDLISPLTRRSDVTVTGNPGGPEDDLSRSRKGLLASLRPHSPYTFSCSPYLAGNHPTRDRAAAWGGRAAMAFANSVLGARSEAEDFCSAMASAITGLTAERGLLLTENRRPTLSVTVTGGGGRDLGLLGYRLSALVRGQVPVFTGLCPDFDEMKRFALGLNAEGRVPLFYLRRPGPPNGLEDLEVRASDCLGSVELGEDPDLLLFGCPHLSEQDINRWGRYLAGRVPGRAKAWFFSSRLCVDKCPLTGAVLAARGRLLTDVCPLSMAGDMVGRTVGCDSPALAACLSASGIDCTALPHAELTRLLAR
jgi:predicted aconitase